MKNFIKSGLKPLDALHLSCAKEVQAQYFITVDKGILKLSSKVMDSKVISPIDFIQLFEDSL